MLYPETESVSLEWKREVPSNDQILKTVIGFCNQFGGRLVLGVDSHGEVVGVPDETIETVLEYLEKTLFEATQPPIIPRIYSQRFGEKTILVIEVSEGMSKPYFRKSEGVEAGTYIRIGRSTLRATTEVIEELRWYSRGIDFEATPNVRSTPDDLDDRLIKQFLDSRRNQARAEPSQELLLSYQLLCSEHGRCMPTQGGLLLFGRSPQRFLSEAMILCTHFRGIVGREAIASVDCEGTLFQQYQQAHAFVVSRLYKAFQIQGSRREERLEIPEVALREALLNALVHRNYHLKSPTKIAIYDDRIEIFSPGGFPGPIPPDRLEAGMTYLRNPVICRIFREYGYIEKLGSGLIAILRSYREHHLPVPQIINAGDHVKVILPRPSSDDRLPPAAPADVQTSLDLLFAQSPEISLKDVQMILGLSRATASRRVSQWIAEGLIERKGHTSAVRFLRR